MSTLAAARADNFYYPPEFDPKKHKTLAKFTGQHPLRERAKKLDQGILVIRFEVPFNIWCTQCGLHIGKGVRFNAEKQQVGNYLSTKIWSFSMRHHCGCKIVIQTDPKNAEYVITEGARKKEEDYSAEDAGVEELQGDEYKAQLAADPFFKLEHVEGRKAARLTGLQELQELQRDAAERQADPYALNKELRARLRRAKKEDAHLEAERAALGLPDHIKLAPRSDEDAQLAAIAMTSNDVKFRHNWRSKREGILTQGIFDAAPAPKQARPQGAASAAGAAKRSLSDKVQLLAKRQRL